MMNNSRMNMKKANSAIQDLLTKLSVAILVIFALNLVCFCVYIAFVIIQRGL